MPGLKQPESTSRRRRWISLCGGVLAVLLLTFIYWRLRDSGWIDAIMDEDGLRRQIDGLGAWGPLAVVALMVLAILVSPIPSAPIAMAAGAAYGHGWGTLYVLTGAEIGALAAFGLARVLGGAVLGRWFGERLALGLCAGFGCLAAPARRVA